MADRTISHLWSGRFDTPPEPETFEFGRSFPLDRRLFEDDVVASMAWAEALGAAGVIDRADTAAITSALAEILETGRRDPSFLQGPDEDVHAFVERQLVSRIGDAGRRLHTGRSRNDQVSVDLRLYLRRRVPLLQVAIARLVLALTDQAAHAGSALMPAYTHLRRAQPVLVAHLLLAPAAALRRDYQRFSDAIREADEMPLGSGAVAGTSYAIDTAALARRLGFSRVVANSIDASSDRDFVTSFLYACAVSMVHLSRLAEDLVILTGDEFGIFELADEVATGSSLMPHKKNPDPLELIRGKAGRVIGHLTGWLATLKALPSGYSKDLQEDKAALFDAEDTLGACLSASAIVVGGLTLNRERAAQHAQGLVLATDVADYLVARGVPFRQAHELVGRMVRHLAAARRDFASLGLHEWRAFSDLFGDDVIGRFTPQASVAARATPQSTHPDAVSSQLADVRRWAEARAGEATDTRPGPAATPSSLPPRP